MSKAACCKIVQVAMHDALPLLTETPQGMVGAKIRHTQLMHLSWKRTYAWGLTETLFFQLVKNAKLPALPMILRVCVFIC